MFRDLVWRTDYNQEVESFLYMYMVPSNTIILRPVCLYVCLFVCHTFILSKSKGKTLVTKGKTMVIKGKTKVTKH